MDLSPEQFDQLKWRLLHEAGSAENIGTAYGVAKLFLPGLADTEIDSLVRDAFFDLYDDGLVRFFYADIDDGYRGDPERFASLERSVVLEELSAPDRGSPQRPPGEFVFFVETLQGAEVFSRLPAGSVPRVSGNVPRPE